MEKALTITLNPVIDKSTTTPAPVAPKKIALHTSKI